MPGNVLKLLQKPLVLCIMNMTVEHIGSRTSVLLQAVLPLVAQDRIMAQNHLPPVV